MTRAGDGHGAGVDAPGIAAPVHSLVVPAGVLGHARKVWREREPLEHVDGVDHVAVDHLPFLVCERAPRHQQVVELLGGDQRASNPVDGDVLPRQRDEAFVIRGCK